VKPCRRNGIQTFNFGDTLPLGGLPWQALHAPGHTYAQSCLFQPDTGQLLSADMLLAAAPAPVLEPPADRGPQARPALAQFLESLAMVEALDINTVYPGHGEPFGDHRQVIARQRERLHQRQTECLALIAAGQRTVAALMAQMYPGQFHLTGLWMLTGYLDMLLAQGRIEEQFSGPVCRYYLTN
jgi:glyoxylase-like metal-dependent hydrolase (beta-lactamase superfamily II)